MDLPVQASSSEPSQVYHAVAPAHRIECLWWCLVVFAQPEQIKVASTMDQPKMDQFIVDSIIPLKPTSAFQQPRWCYAKMPIAPASAGGPAIAWVRSEHDSSWPWSKRNWQGLFCFYIFIHWGCVTQWNWLVFFVWRRENFKLVQYIEVLQALQPPPPHIPKTARVVHAPAQD